MKLRKTLSILSAAALITSMAVSIMAEAPKTPTISLVSGEKVTYGTEVIITCDDPSSVYVYYTTDGSDPSASSSIYTAPITVTGDVTVKAIAINDTKEASSIAKSSIDVLPELKFSDAESCSKIEYALGVLIENDVIVNSGEFNPGEKITYRDLFRMLGYAGYEIDAADYKDIDQAAALTNAEMANFIYDYIIGEEMVEAEKANRAFLKFRMNNFSDIEEDEYAVFTTLLSYNIIDGEAFSPNSTATKSSLAYAVAGMIENI